MLQWPETQNWEDLETAENRIQAKDLSSELVSEIKSQRAEMESLKQSLLEALDQVVASVNREA